MFEDDSPNNLTSNSIGVHDVLTVGLDPLKIVNNHSVNVGNMNVEENLPKAHTEIKMSAVSKQYNKPDIIPSSEQLDPAPIVDKCLNKSDHTHEIKSSRYDISSIDLTYLPLIELPDATPSYSFDSSPFHLQHRARHRPTKSQAWLKYLDFVRERTCNSAFNQHEFQHNEQF